MNIINLEDSIEKFLTEENKEHLTMIIENFSSGHFEETLAQIQSFQENHPIQDNLGALLSMIRATCYAQTGKHKQAAQIIKELYENGKDASVDDIILYGNLAFMCDYRLSRRIMSDAVKRLEKEDSIDRQKTAQAYQVLGEAEERLDKLIRAVRYFKRSLTFYRAEKEHEKTILYLHFKLGMLQARLNERDEAIDYFTKVLELADENEKEVQINSLVSIAKLYANEKEHEKVSSYLQKAFPLLENSTLTGRFVHGEAYTEMAYNYFAQAQYDEAIPYYEKAIAIFTKIPNFSNRELGVIYMQYAYCLEHKNEQDTVQAGKYYEAAYEQLKNTNELDLLENSLADIIRFFDSTNNKRKKRFYEEKIVQLLNKSSHAH